MFNKIKKYFSLVTFSHTIFALPFAMIGFFLAERNQSNNFSWRLLLLVILCMVFARNAAMGFNRYLDRSIDKLNPRTKNREIPAGLISAKSALLFVIINSILFIVTTFFINHLTFYLSPIALGVILAYSYTKRITPLCHFILGIGLALAPIGAYISVTGFFNYFPLFFSFIVLFWVSGFDIIYALQDEEFDKQKKLKSIPVFMGVKNALFLSIGLHTLTVVLVIGAGIYGQMGIIYWIGTLIFIGLLTYQHLLVKSHDLSKINLAFGTTNGVASLLFATCTIIDFFFTK